MRFASAVRHILLAVVAPVVVTIALVPLRDHVNAANLALLLVLVVLGVALTGGRVVAAVAGAMTALAFDFLLTVPYGAFTIRSRDDILTTVLLVVVGLVAGEIVARARRSEAEARAQHSEVERVHRRAELAAGGEPPGRLIARTGDELAAMLGLVDVRYVRGPAPSTMAVLTHWGALLPGGPSPTGAETVALPVRAHGRDVGHFELVFSSPTGGMAVSVDTRHAAVAAADQLGMALLRYERPA
jgi:K+-sensing histidine kinase KdpD